MKKKRIRFPIMFLFNFSAIALIVLLTALALDIVLFSTAYGRTQDTNYLIPMIIIGSILLLVFVFMIIILARRLRKYYKDGLFQITLHNFSKINSGSPMLETYPEGRIQEFADLNEQVRRLRTTLNNASLIFASLDYHRFNLEFIEGFEDLVTLESFAKDISNVIAASLSFRNAIIEFYYETIDEPLSDEEINRFIGEIRKALSTYDDLLLLLPKDRSSIYAFLPRLESFSFLTERCLAVSPQLALSRHTRQGYIAMPVHTSIVCYPFSAVHELLPDLRYSKRQGKLMNLYLPNRLHEIGDATIGKNAMHLNQMSKILYNISSLESTKTNQEEIRKGIASVLSAICRELKIETAGIVAYGAEEGGYICTDQVFAAAPFAIGDRIDPVFIDGLMGSADSDHSFFFSNRDRLTRILAQAADRFQIKSGFFYIMISNGRPIGFIYFINQNHELNLDSYMQEAMSVASYHITSSFVIGRAIEDVNEMQRLNDALLAHGDSAAYQVERETFRLLGTSSNFKRLVGQIGDHTTCHRAIFGLVAPCKNCPLLTGNKNPVEIKGKPFTSSLTLETKKGATCTMLLRRVQQQEDNLDRYDHDLLINSFHSLFDEVKKHFEVSDNGYLLLLRVDNHADLLSKYGSEGLLLIYRGFIERLKKILGGAESIYSFDSQTFGLLFPAIGQGDVLNRCEDIFNVTKNIVYQGDETYSLELTYRPMNYPQGYAQSSDFFRHMYRELNTRKIEAGRDMVYFDDSDYVRPASRRQFMLNVIDEQFGKETFTVSLQPMVRATTKKIYGAEMLLRIQDEYRHIVFNADELVHVAEENGKIPLITRSLLRYVSSFYSSLGAKTLEDMGFQRISLNTEVALFSDESFEEDFQKFLKENHFPNQFLSFEIAERDIYDHLKDFEYINKYLTSCHAEVVVDQYSGRFLSLDALARIGVSHIKVSRNLVINIDSDQRKFNDIKLLLEEARAKGIHATVVGVENIDQYNLLLGVDNKINMQGYHFFRPLDRNALLDALRVNRGND